MNWPYVPLDVAANVRLETNVMLGVAEPEASGRISSTPLMLSPEAA